MKQKKLYTDEHSKKFHIRKADLGLDHLNTYILLIEKDLKRKLSDEDKILAKENGIEPFQEELKKQYPFPNGTQQINEDAMGISLRQSTPYFQKFQSSFSELPVILKKGKFIIENYEEIKDVSLCTMYADNPQRIEALKYAERLCKTLNSAPKGCIERNITGIEDSIPVVEYLNKVFVPNGIEIYRI